eukprot:gene6957-7033_t
MTPDEKQLLAGLFDRLRATSTDPRDAEAEAFINSAMVQTPGAAYILAQTVLIQEQALSAANQRILQLQQPQQQSGASFLGGIGKSLFGQTAPQQQPAYAPQQPAYAPPQPNYAPQPVQQQAGPWGASAPSSFLGGALKTAAGVAGGVMLAEGISSLFRGGHGMMSGIAGPSFGQDYGMGNETIVNNYYGDSRETAPDQGQDASYDTSSDDSDYSSDFGGDDV